MLRTQCGLSVAAVVILLANVLLADIIVQPGYQQPAEYNPAFERRASSQEEKQTEHAAIEQNAHYIQAYPSINLYPRESRAHTLAHPPLWQSPYPLPAPYSSAPKVVQPMRVTKIGGMGYVQPSYIVGSPQFPTSAVPSSRHRRSTNEKDTGDSNAVAPNPTLIDISTKLSGSEDAKFEDIHMTLPEESDDKREKREKRIDVRQSKNEAIVGNLLGINPDKKYPGHHEYQPPVVVQRIRHSPFLPPQSLQSDSNEPIQQVTPHPEKQPSAASSSQNQHTLLNIARNVRADQKSQTNVDNNERRAVQKAGDSKTNSQSEEPKAKSSEEDNSQISIQNVPSQLVKRQGLFDDAIDINVNSGNTVVQPGNMDYPSLSGPSGPPTGAGMPDGDFSSQANFMVESARCSEDRTQGASQRNFPDPRPHKHDTGHQHSRDKSEQATAACDKEQQIPVAKDRVEFASECNCQPSLLPASSILPQYSLFPSTSLYYRPIRIQPLQMIRPSVSDCVNTKMTLGNTAQVLPTQTERPQIESITHTPTARYYSYPQNYNYAPTYKSAYTMPSHVYPPHYYMVYRSNLAPQIMYQQPVYY